MTSYHRARVDCYAGYRAEEEPRSFSWGGDTLEIVRIMDRWLDPNHRYFKVHAEDDGIYILRHDTNRGEWEVSVFLHGGALP